MNHGRYKDAEVHFRKVISLTPDNYTAYDNLAALYLKTGRSSDAIPVLERSLSLNKTASAYSNLGTAYYYQRNFAEAVGNYEKAVKLMPTNLVYWGNLGDACQRVPALQSRANEALTQAISLARHQLQVNPDEPATYRAARGSQICFQCPVGNFTITFPNTPFGTLELHGTKGQIIGPFSVEEIPRGRYHYKVPLHGCRRYRR